MNKRPASTEIADRREAHINFLDFAVGSCFCKIHCVKSRETIAECMQLFNCQSVKTAQFYIELFCD